MNGKVCGSIIGLKLTAEGRPHFRQGSAQTKKRAAEHEEEVTAVPGTPHCTGSPPRKRAVRASPRLSQLFEEQSVRDTSAGILLTLSSREGGETGPSQSVIVSEKAGPTDHGPRAKHWALRDGAGFFHGASHNLILDKLRAEKVQALIQKDKEIERLKLQLQKLAEQEELRVERRNQVLDVHRQMPVNECHEGAEGTGWWHRPAQLVHGDNPAGDDPWCQVGQVFDPQREQEVHKWAAGEIRGDIDGKQNIGNWDRPESDDDSGRWSVEQNDQEASVYLLHQVEIPSSHLSRQTLFETEMKQWRMGRSVLEHSSVESGSDAEAYINSGRARHLPSLPVPSKNDDLSWQDVENQRQPAQPAQHDIVQPKLQPHFVKSISMQASKEDAVQMQFNCSSTQQQLRGTAVPTLHHKRDDECRQLSAGSSISNSGGDSDCSGEELICGLNKVVFTFGGGQLALMVQAVLATPRADHAFVFGRAKNGGLAGRFVIPSVEKDFIEVEEEEEEEEEEPAVVKAPGAWQFPMCTDMMPAYECHEGAEEPEAQDDLNPWWEEEDDFNSWREEEEEAEAEAVKMEAEAEEEAEVEELGMLQKTNVRHRLRQPAALPPPQWRRC